MSQKLPFSNVTLAQNDVEELACSLGQFDRITCASGLVLLRNIPKALRSWRNMLAPGGLVVILMVRPTKPLYLAFWLLAQP